MKSFSNQDFNKNSVDHFQKIKTDLQKNRITLRDLLESNDYQYLTKNELIELCKIAALSDISQFQYVKELIDTAAYKNLCLDFVKQNPMVLEYISNLETRSVIIETITPAIILRKNFSAKKFFKKNDPINFSEILKDIEYVIVTKGHEAEVNTSCLIYASGEKRKDKTIRVESEDVEALLHKLNQLGTQKINLTLIGHHSLQDPTIAGINAKYIINLLEKFNIIHRVILFGCFSVDGQLFNNEKEKIIAFSELEKKKFEFINHASGFATLFISSDEPLNESLYKNLLPQIEKTMKLKHNYVLIKNKNNQFKLLYLEQNQITKNFTLNDNKLSDLQKIINKNKLFKFNQSLVAYFRNENPLSLALQYEILDVCDDLYPSLEKSHPKYKERKETLPFLGKTIIAPSESDKLSKSLFRDIAENITVNKKISHSIKIKGYRKVLSVDTVEVKFHSVNHSIFSKTENISNEIDRKKLRLEYREKIKTLRNPNLRDESISKSLEMEIAPKKKTGLRRKFFPKN